MKKLDSKTLLTKRNIFYLVGLLVFLIIPWFMSNTDLTIVSRIFIFAVYAMAYDILRGYTGFINLGFAIFLGGGAYFVGILFTQFASSYLMLLLAVLGTVVYCLVWALIIGKVAASGGSVLATAMITMAFGEIMRNVMERLRFISNGADGISYKLPELLKDRVTFYYIAFVFLIVMFVLLYKFVRSPTGRVLQGIRENEQRLIFLGYNTNRARTIGLIVSGVAAGLAGVMYGLLQRFVNTDVMAMQMTYNAMLYSLIGGTGTLYGSIIGSAVVILFQNLLLDLRSVSFIFERWLLFFGALYIVVIMYMPYGIVGFIKNQIEKYKVKKGIIKA